MAHADAHVRAEFIRLAEGAPTNARKISRRRERIGDEHPTGRCINQAAAEPAGPDAHGAPLDAAFAPRQDERGRKPMDPLDIREPT
jgi:hypothetical protein